MNDAFTGVEIDPGQGPDRLNITWTASASSDVAAYNVYRASSGAGPFNLVNIKLIAGLAGEARLPTVSVYRQFVVDGGLMGYGPDTPDIFRRSAAYVDRILKGAKPGDLPVQEPIKYEFTINLKTAKALGLSVPMVLQMTANEVIE